MTTLIRWLNSPYILSTLLLAGVTTDLVLIGQACDLSKSDWAAWVGAIGTVATLIGTIHLATAETRRRTRQERIAADMRGVSLGARFSYAGGRLIVAKVFSNEPAIERKIALSCFVIATPTLLKSAISPQTRCCHWSLLKATRRPLLFEQRLA